MPQESSNKVYIGQSLDGFIARKNGDISFLDTFPFPENDDMGYAQFMAGIDALLMGRNSFEKVLSFGIDWPYTKPVYVWSQQLKQLPHNLPANVFLVNGTLPKILEEIHSKGHYQLYIDGAKTIQSFLQADAIHELTITTVPVLIGEGISLFGQVPFQLNFKCTAAKTYENGLCQCTYQRIRE